MKINQRSLPMNNPIILALDVDTRDEALQIADEVGEIVGGFKLGPRLCLRHGASLVKEIQARGPVFLDNKHFDIPSTMEAAVRASFDAGASLVTIHALCGVEALKKMAEVERELNQQRPFKVLAVTILTSWEQNNLPRNLLDLPLAQHVELMADAIISAGLTGLVCSPHELELLKEKNLYLVTPGIRFSLQESGDQKRIMDPQSALKLGASALVVGRPILQAKNRKEAATDFVMAVYE